MADLSSYVESVLSPADRELFHEAAISAAHGARRGAYILIWISCAESLKRKFREAAQRDPSAQKVVQQIENSEQQHSSVDMKILAEAKKYGFIDDTVYQKLKFIYDMRCVYGHPYETAPVDAELINAASIVVEEVLAKPTTLKKPYIDMLLEQLTTDPNFIDNSRDRVQDFAKETSTRISPVVYGYLIANYTYFLESHIDDPSLQVFTYRASWFITQFLKSVGIDFYKSDKWHQFVSKYPKSSQWIFLTDQSLLEEIGDLAKSYIISYTINNAEKRPKALHSLEPLFLSGKLSELQKTNLLKLDIAQLKAGRFKLSIIYGPVITACKSRNWPIQSHAMEVIETATREELNELDEAQQEELGRNVLQVADGDCWAAKGFCAGKLLKHQGDFPRSFIKGFLFESFLNNDSEFRLKLNILDTVLEILKQHDDIKRELVDAINGAGPKVPELPSVYEGAVAQVGIRPELEDLKNCMIANRSKLTITDDL